MALHSTDLKVTDRLVFEDLAVGDHKLWVPSLPRKTVTHLQPITPTQQTGHTFPVSLRIQGTLPSGLDTVLGTTLRVFKWLEFGWPVWSDIALNPFPANHLDHDAPCPNNPLDNWVDHTLGRILGATRRKTNEVWFAWAASKGGGFPHVHIQVAQIDPSNFAALILKKQWPIWNPDFAFAYPSLHTNERDDVGLAVAFGSGQYNPSSAVGIADENSVLGGGRYTSRAEQRVPVSLWELSDC